MDASKNEKSFDNRCAALVSRKGRAPRARAGRKSFAFNALGPTGARQTARGAQVSRAARGSKRCAKWRPSSQIRLLCARLFRQRKMVSNGKIYDSQTPNLGKLNPVQLVHLTGVTVLAHA